MATKFDVALKKPDLSTKSKEARDVLNDVDEVDKKALEQRLLMQSAGLMALLAISGTVMGIITGSSAILMDGVTAFIGVIIKVMMIGTSKLIERETSKRFQFGFWQFEPLVLIMEGSFTLLIVIYALSSGLTALLTGGREVHLGVAIGYAAFFLIADTMYYFYVRKVNKTLKSNLVKFDNISWSIDAMLEAAILVSFIFAWGLSYTDYAYLSIYIDPIVLIVLSLQMLPSAIKILIPSLKQIIGVAPLTYHNRIQFIMDDFMKRYKFRDYVTSIQAYGNVKMIEIDILVDKHYPIHQIHEFDRIRNEIDDAIGGNPDEKWLTITFTATKRWMAKDYLLDEDEDD